ncbi:hypothetical protein FQA39_LY10191 [Lamprigera yunnana]|nr:hypothetical protein FQA39_LY10191 [Lamprigera yunnana]
MNFDTIALFSGGLVLFLHRVIWALDVLVTALLNSPVKIPDRLSVGGEVYFWVIMKVQKTHPRIVFATKITVQKIVIYEGEHQVLALFFVIKVKIADRFCNVSVNMAVNNKSSWTNDSDFEEDLYIISEFCEPPRSGEGTPWKHKVKKKSDIYKEEQDENASSSRWKGRGFFMNNELRPVGGTTNFLDKQIETYKEIRKLNNSGFYHCNDEIERMLMVDSPSTSRSSSRNSPNLLQSVAVAKPEQPLPPLCDIIQKNKKANYLTEFPKL